MKLNSTARNIACKKQGAKRAGRQEPLLGAVRGRRAKSMAESEAMQAVIDALGRERIAQMESHYGTKTVYYRILREYAGLDPIVVPE